MLPCRAHPRPSSSARSISRPRRRPRHAPAFAIHGQSSIMFADALMLAPTHVQRQRPHFRRFHAIFFAGAGCPPADMPCHGLPVFSLPPLHHASRHLLFAMLKRYYFHHRCPASAHLLVITRDFYQMPRAHPYRRFRLIWMLFYARACVRLRMPP